MNIRGEMFGQIPKKYFYYVFSLDVSIVASMFKSGSVHRNSSV